MVVPQAKTVSAAPPLSRLRRALRALLHALWLQVLIAILAGIAVGILFPHGGVALKPLGDGFIKLIRMTLAPIIFATVVVGIARMGDLKEVGRVGAKALLYFEAVSSLSLLLGLVAVDLLRPGRGMNIDPAALDAHAIAGYTSAARQPGFVDFLMSILPASVGEAFVSGNMLQIILFAVLFGLAVARFRRRAQPLVEILDLLLQGMFGIVKFVMYLAPLGAFGAMAYTVGQYGVSKLVQLAQFTAEVWIASILFVALVLGGIARAAGFRLPALLRYLREEILVTLGTASSEAVLAPLMLKLEQLGCAESIVGMVMPAGYTFNADGTAIYLSMGAIFIAQATNTHLGLRDQIVLLLLLMLTSKGSAGVAGAGFVTLAATLASTRQIPVAGLVLLLGVDRFTNAARAAVNVIGNSVATIVVSKWEGAFDAERANRALGGLPGDLDERIAAGSEP
ncbi:MAG TPA: C4-dicarboxylate transporter DctA [Acidobacteriaceae bacterium]|nr:C4-dicarboxylate transporter DctA [Acidobacteriaceae bacterium]